MIPARYIFRTSFLFFFLAMYSVDAQELNDVGVSMKEYIKENHLEKIEDMIHKLAMSKPFLDQFLKEEERYNVDVSQIKRKDVSIGEDVDIYVRHFTEHQNFTMILVPINIYSLAIYDTLLFSVLEVTDYWLDRTFPYENFKIDSVKSGVLSLKAHDILVEHLYDQTLHQMHLEMGQFKIHIQESYVGANSFHEHIGELSKDEKQMVRSHWGLLKKAFSHQVDLNVEFNIYVFGFNDLEVNCKTKEREFNHKITPSNIFTRHHFSD